MYVIVCIKYITSRVVVLLSNSDSCQLFFKCYAKIVGFFLFLRKRIFKSQKV